jgi:CheY-like chemotaxis protein
MMKKILAVDDSELLHRMYDLILMRYRRQGAEVLHADDGREALDLLVRHSDISLILLDINMPIMGGLEFLTVAQARGLLTDVAVLIISTEGKQDDTLLGLRRGARGYLTKPFQPNDLYALIDQMFPTDVSPEAKAAR